MDQRRAEEKTRRESLSAKVQQRLQQIDRPRGRQVTRPQPVSAEKAAYDRAWTCNKAWGAALSKTGPRALATEERSKKPKSPADEWGAVHVMALLDMVKGCCSAVLPLLQSEALQPLVKDNSEIAAWKTFIEGSMKLAPTRPSTTTASGSRTPVVQVDRSIQTPPVLGKLEEGPGWTPEVRKRVKLVFVRDQLKDWRERVENNTRKEVKAELSATVSTSTSTATTASTPVTSTATLPKPLFTDVVVSKARPSFPLPATTQPSRMTPLRRRQATPSPERRTARPPATASSSVTADMWTHGDRPDLRPFQPGSSHGWAVGESWEERRKKAVMYLVPPDKARQWIALTDELRDHLLSGAYATTEPAVLGRTVQDEFAAFTARGAAAGSTGAPGRPPDDQMDLDRSEVD